MAAAISTSPRIRLVDLSKEPVDSYVFDRRRETRCRARGTVTGFVTPKGGGVLCSIRRFELIDTSDHGVGLTADNPLQIDDSVSLTFPSHGGEPAMGFEGKVVRCEPAEGQAGYRIGLYREQTGPSRRAS